VRHVLTLKYLAGLFAHPLTDPDRVKNAELTPASLAAARHRAHFPRHLRTSLPRHLRTSPGMVFAVQLYELTPRAGRDP
jgi:hypothetical protein